MTGNEVGLVNGGTDSGMVAGKTLQVTNPVDSVLWIWDNQEIRGSAVFLTPITLLFKALKVCETSCKSCKAEVFVLQNH